MTALLEYLDFHRISLNFYQVRCTLAPVIITIVLINWGRDWGFRFYMWVGDQKLRYDFYFFLIYLLLYSTSAEGL